MKNIFKTSLSLLLSLSLLGCNGGKKGVTGTFNGTGAGFKGDITVTLKLENSSLVEASIVGDKETPNIGGAAIEKITAEMNEHKTVNVDAVSGATYTSTGIINAIDAALKEAGLTKESFPVIEQTTGTVIEKETDLLILGAGGAGLACGNSALESGVADVTILEKMPYTGGATANAGGVDAGLSKLQEQVGITGDSEQLIHDDILKSGEGHNEDLVWIMAKQQGKMLDWMIESQNVPFKDRFASDFPEHTVQRFFICEGGMTVATKILTENFTSKGGKLELENTAQEFILDDKGNVVGVVSQDAEGNTIKWTAKAVVVATGGYGANQEIISQKKSDLQYAVFYGVKSSMGEGQLMGEKINAKMRNMGYAKMYPNGIDKGNETGEGYATPMPTLTAANSTGAIFVNLDGKRFVNETLPFASIKNEVTMQPEKMMYLVMDQTGYDKWSEMVSTNTSAIGNISMDKQEEFFNADSGKPVFARGTVEEVAEKAGINVENLKSTITDWNTAVAAGSDSQYGRTALFNLNTDKLYVVEQRLRFATTLGGYDITKNFEAQYEDGSVIQGLYAVGEVVGGPNGTEAIPGSMACWAITSGFVCGQHLGEVLAQK